MVWFCWSSRNCCCWMSTGASRFAEKRRHNLYQKVVPLFLVDRNQGAGLQRSFNFLVGVRKHFKVKVGECLLRVFVGRLALLAIHCSLSRTVVGVQWNSKSIRCGGEGFLLRRRIIFVHKDGSEEFVECRRLLDILTE